MRWSLVMSTSHLDRQACTEYRWCQVQPQVLEAAGHEGGGERSGRVYPGPADRAGTGASCGRGRTATFATRGPSHAARPATRPADGQDGGGHGVPRLAEARGDGFITTPGVR